MYKQVTSKGDNVGTSFSCEAKTSSCKSAISRAFKTLDNMVVLGKCCCCDLKTGVIVLGVFNLIFPVIWAIICSWVLVLLAANTIAGSQSDDLNSAVQEYSSAIEVYKSALQEYSSAVQEYNIQEEYNKFNTDGDFNKLISDLGIGLGFCVEHLWICIVSCIITIICSSLLIHGARKGKPGLLSPYMIVSYLRIIFYALFFIKSCFAIGGFHIGNFLGMLFLTTLEIFFFLCVFSLSQEQKRDMKLKLGEAGLKKRKGPLIVWEQRRGVLLPQELVPGNQELQL